MSGDAIVSGLKAILRTYSAGNGWTNAKYLSGELLKFTSKMNEADFLRLTKREKKAMIKLLEYTLK